MCPEQVVDGLDRAVKKMKKGEVALVTIQPEYAFGPSETQQELAIIPANATVDYEVELLSFVKVGVRCCFLCDTLWMKVIVFQILWGYDME